MIAGESARSAELLGSRPMKSSASSGRGRRRRASAWRRWLGLSVAERRLFGRALLLLGLVRVLLRRAPLRALLRFARPAAARSGPAGARVLSSGARARAIAQAVERAARVLPGTSTCLARALVAQRLLQQAGLVAELRIGVARDDSAAGLAAHAWVVHDGRVLVGDQPQLERYDELPRLP